MNAIEIKEKLEHLGACKAAMEWADGKTLQEIWDTCPRGDWMLWLFRRANNYDLKTISLAKGYCANTVRHLMKDNRSLIAVDAAIKFGMGEITQEEMADAASYAAYAAADAAYAAYAAADAASDAASYAADAAADAADAASYAADAARTTNQLLTADICRQYLPFPIL